jgi:hypothetical protein
MADSLQLAGSIELLGGGSGVVSTLPLCNGATFTVSPGYGLGAPQPIVDIVESLVLNGERPYGTRASNRTVTLPVSITAPDRTTLAGAIETLLQLIDQQTWTLQWTRDPGAGTPLPLILDCFRANPSKPVYNLIDAQQFSADITVEFQALPYGRSDVAQQLTFASPLTGTTAPPPPVTLDTFATVSGSHWSRSTIAVVGSYSAVYNSLYTFTGVPARYVNSSLGGLDITGLLAVGFWIGAGTPYYYYYNGLGNFTFALTLTDTSGNVLSFGTSQTITVSDHQASPVWTYVTVPVPQGADFDYASVAGYSFEAWNYPYGGPSVLYTVVYLNDLQAVPASGNPVAAERGSIYTLAGVSGTAPAPMSLQFQQAGTGTPTEAIYTTGSGTWEAPGSVSSVMVENTGPGGNGAEMTIAGKGGGGQGGEYACEPAYPVVPGDFYHWAVGTAGSQTTFDGTGVVANPGASAATNSTTGASGAPVSTNSVVFEGGHGANGSSSGGGGGGSSGGSASAGNPGTGTTGGAAVTGGGPGGNGALSSGHPGSAGTAPGGAGAGAWSGGGTQAGGAGANGQVKLTYTVTDPAFATLIAHRPGPDAPASLNPLIPVGSGADVPNGETFYQVPSLVTGVPAIFGGTYSVMLVADNWASPSTSRTVTVTVYQYEYPGGPSSQWPVAWTFEPATQVTNGMVTLGELTLPGNDIAPDNTQAYFAITVTSTETGDRFLDCLMLDTMGQTCWVNLPSSDYTTFYIDAPDVDRDLGRVMGSIGGRAEAVSVMASTFVSGGPMTIDPSSSASPILMAYCIEGAPSLVAYYYPAWYIDRLA